MAQKYGFVAGDKCHKQVNNSHILTALSQHSDYVRKLAVYLKELQKCPGGGVLNFGLDGGVPPGPQDPNPCLESKMYPCLGILLPKWTHV